MVQVLTLGGREGLVPEDLRLAGLSGRRTRTRITSTTKHNTKSVAHNFVVLTDYVVVKKQIQSSLSEAE